MHTIKVLSKNSGKILVEVSNESASLTFEVSQDYTLEEILNEFESTISNSMLMEEH